MAAQIVFVFFYVTYLIQCDPNIFISGTVCDGGTLSIGTVHTGDAFVHVYPFVGMVVLMLGGLYHMVNAELAFVRETRHWARTLLYWGMLQFLITIPLVVYILIEDPRKRYSDKIDYVDFWWTGLLFLQVSMLAVQILLNIDHTRFFSTVTPTVPEPKPKPAKSTIPSFFDLEQITVK
jgi:hypothetical protein